VFGQLEDFFILPPKLCTLDAQNDLGILQRLKNFQFCPNHFALWKSLDAGKTLGSYLGPLQPMVILVEDNV
jgi:hypothetical protein